MRRRAPALTSQAVAQAEAWAAAFETAATTMQVAKAAHRLVINHHFQVWDAVIWSAARSAGARIFLSEDMQDGLELDGLRVVDPFRLSAPAFDALLSDDPPPGKNKG